MTKPIFKNVKIPFSGFYESAHDSEIDHALESYFDKEGDGKQAVPENLYWSFDHFGDIHREYAELYAKHFGYYFEEATGIKFPLVLEALKSPREYNFETDRIFCDVRLSVLKAIYAYCDKDILRQRIAECFTSRSGFMSFYSNDLDTWTVKPLKDWDHNELGTLIEAALITSGCGTGVNPTFNSWDVMEDAICNGKIDEIVYPYLAQWEKENPTGATRVKTFFSITDDEWDDTSKTRG